jgi:WD40 repeat protein
VTETREKARISEHGGPVHSVSFSPDGRWLASGSRDTTIRMANLEVLLASKETVLDEVEEATGLELEETDSLRQPPRSK